MYLKRLEIQGFKSFAVKTSMEFEPGITAVVGPNGSGKSNVADSVRWVLGEQSTKMLRGKKSDDVVFAGSDKKTRSGFAEVVATFDNADRIIPIDAPEVSIGRRIDRSGESEYLLNGQKTRLMDIVDLVLKSNIGTSRYTVIGQGTIDALIMSGPSEIKGLLDEASGVKVYQMRRERTLRRLEQTTQNLMRVEDVIAELEPRLKSLRRQAKKMEAREQIETELKVLLREFWGGQYHDLSVKINHEQGLIQEFTKAKDSLKNQQQVLIERRDALVEKESGIGGKFTEIRTEISSLQEKKNSLLEKKSMLSGKVLSLKNQGAVSPDVLKAELASVEKELSDLRIQIGEDDKSLEEVKNKESTLEVSLKELNTKIERLYAELSGKEPLDEQQVEGVIKEVEFAVDQFEATLGGMETIADALTHIRSFKDTLRSLRSKLNSLFNAGGGKPQATTEQFSELSALRASSEQELKMLASSRSALSVGLQLKRKQLQDLERKSLDLYLELEKTNPDKIDTLASDIATEQQRIEQDLKLLSVEIGKMESLLQNFDQEAKERRVGLSELESNLRSMQTDLEALQVKISSHEIERTKFDTELKLLEKEIVEFFGPQELVVIKQDHSPATTPELEHKIAKLKSSLEQIGGVDEMTMQEYQETEERYNHLTTQVADLRKGMDDLKSVMDELDEHIKGKFNSAFHRVNEKFEHYFRMLFSGGKAYLTLVKNQQKDTTDSEEGGLEESSEEDSVDVLRPEEKLLKKYEHSEELVVGVDIKATPPGKKLASVQALSGGERALTAIALLCSLLACFPSPFVVLDEVDAALDEANTIRFGQILGSLAHQTQFLTITHNRETMAQSSTLYGVTMGDDGVSKILSIKLDQATAYAK